MLRPSMGTKEEDQRRLTPPSPSPSPSPGSSSSLCPAVRALFALHHQEVPEAEAQARITAKEEDRGEAIRNQTVIKPGGVMMSTQASSPCPISRRSNNAAAKVAGLLREWATFIEEK